MSKPDPAAPFDIRAFVGLSRVADVTPSPCGTWAAVVVERLNDDGAAYVSDIWRLPLDGGPPIQLTLGPVRDRAPQFRHDGALAFLSNRLAPDAKDERDRNQVWVIPAIGGEPRPVTDEPLGVGEFQCARDADRMVVVTQVTPGVDHDKQREDAHERSKNGPSALHYTRMPVRFWDHWIPMTETHLVAMTCDGHDRRDLTPAPGRALIEAHWDLSPDGTAVATGWASENPNDRINDVQVALIDAADGTRTMRTAGDMLVHGQPHFSPDSQRVAVSRYTRSPDGYGAKSLIMLSIAGGDAETITKPWDRRPEVLGWTLAADALLVSCDDAGHHPIFSVAVGNGEITRLTARTDGGAHSNLSPVSGGHMGILLRHTRMHPPEVHLISLVEPSSPVPLATFSGFSADDGAKLARQRDVTVDVGDGRTVQVFVVEPVEPPPGPKKSFLWIHGGPVSAWNDSWHWRWSPVLLAAAGYTVILPNPAGSTGFGNRWINDIWGNTWGARCYDDLMAVVDHFADTEALDPAEMIAMGGSFGGYMANWIGANTDRFKLLVTHASLFSLAGFYGVTDVPAWWGLMMGGSVFEGTVDYERYSPSSRVQSWQTPTLILHGEKDYRVPIGESLQLFEALQAQGVASELVVFPDENHWITKPRNIIAWYDAVLDFVARHAQ